MGMLEGSYPPYVEMGMLEGSYLNTKPGVPVL